MYLVRKQLDWGIRSRTSLAFCSAWPFVCPSIYGSEPPVSTRITGPCRVLTSFVLPVHIQGVSSAPLQGHALWTKFLPTTGSFFVDTDFITQIAHSGTFRRTLPATTFCFLHCFASETSGSHRSGRFVRGPLLKFSGRRQYLPSSAVFAASQKT